MEHNENSQDWTRTVREAVDAFSSQVGESSQQLAGAAQRFAAEAGRMLTEASSRSEEAALQSQESASSARTAAAEARQIVDSIRTTLNEAVDQVKQEARSFFEDAKVKTEEATGSSEQSAAALQERIDNAVRQAEQSAIAGREYAARAAVAAEEARIASSQNGGSSVQLSNAVEAAAETARTAAAEIGSLRTAVAAAEQAAREARQIAAEANALAQRAPAQVVAQPAISAGAEEVLERLEADYSLLTKLVQELHSRIASLSSQTAPVYQFAPPAAAQIETEQEDEPADPFYSSPVEDEQAAEALPGVMDTTWQTPSAAEPASWSQPHYTPTAGSFLEDASAEAPSESARSGGETHGTEPAEIITAGPTISGRVLVSISPVPDFDRLLSLDGALGRMAGVGNVTLADYAKEEVTFRVEVDPPTSVEDFRNRLSQSAGAGIEVVASGEEALALRLAS